MLLRLKIVFLSLLFAGALAIFAWKGDWYFYVLLFLVLLSLFFLWPFVYRWRFLAIPFFLSIGSLNLLYLVDGFFERILFILLATVVYYVSVLGAYRLRKYDCDQTAQAMINLSTIVTVFFWFVSNYGWYLNFAIDSWVLVVLFVVSTFFIALPSLTICFTSCYKIKYRKRIGLSGGEKKIYLKALKEQIMIQRVVLFFGVVLALVMGQVIWALSFWPFGYLVTGTVAVIVFFVFWESVRQFIIAKKISKKFLLSNVLLMIILIALMVSTSPWKVVS